jgi:hypothetical protein
MPQPVEIEPLLRCVAQNLLVIARHACEWIALQDAEPCEQFPDAAALFVRQSHIVRAPRECTDRVRTAARIAAGLFFQFENDEIVDAALLQAPSRRQACHAGADDRYLDVSFGCIVGRRGFTQAVSGALIRSE